MSRKLIFAIALAVSILGLIGSRLAAQPPDRSPERLDQHRAVEAMHFERVADFLDLDEDQAERWLQITEDRQAKTRLRLDVLSELRSAFRDEANLETPDAYKLGVIALEIHQERGAMRLEGEQTEAALEALLTPEQVDRFDALREAMRAARPGPPPLLLRHRLAPTQS